jgi:MFS family permease
MGMDFINPSLPYIMKALSTDEYATKYLIVVYLVGVGLSQFIYGTYSDNHGRRNAIIAALIITCLGILLSSFATNISQLYIFRFITGVGAGGAPVIARAIISDVCSDKITIKKAFAYFSMSSQISPAVAPVIGAILQQFFNWRIVFIGLLIVTLIATIILLLSLEETHDIPKQKKSYLQQLLIYSETFKNIRFMALNFASAFIFVVTIAYYSYMPFILHNYQYYPIENAVIYMIYAAGIVLGSFLLAKNLSALNTETILKYCILLYFVFSGLFIISFFLMPKSLILIILATIGFSILCGISAPLTLSMCMYGFTANKGAASAVQSFIKMFFTGIALMVFNFISMKSMISLMLCYLILCFLVLASFCIGTSKKINHNQ